MIDINSNDWQFLDVQARLDLLSREDDLKVAAVLTPSVALRCWRRYVEPTLGMPEDYRSERFNLLRSDVLRVCLALTEPRVDDTSCVADAPAGPMITADEPTDRTYEEPFGAFYEAAAADAAERIRQRLGRVARERRLKIDDRLVSVETIVHDTGLRLRRRLGQQVRRTLILELNADRDLGQLSGNSSEERFAFFCESLRSRERRRRVLERYPYLAECLERICHQHVSFVVELISRYFSDAERIHTELSIPGDARLESVSIGLGDLHDAGGSTSILTLRSGRQERAKVVYKPRSVSAEELVRELFELTCSDSADQDATTGWAMRAPRVVRCNGYGWTQFIESRTDGDLTEFDCRCLGALMAFAQVFRFTDLHKENIVLSAEGPYIVDSETVLQPEFVGGDVAVQLAARSVLGSMLLPSVRRLDEDGNVISNLSLLQADGIASPTRMSTVVDHQTDRARVVTVRPVGPDVSVEPISDVPDVASTPLVAPMERHLDHVVEGYDQCMDRLCIRASHLIARLHTACDVLVRVVFRPTHAYAQLLENSRHPVCLRSSSMRFLNWEELWSHRPSATMNGALVTSEVRQLGNLDVPTFWVRLSSREIADSRGHVTHLAARSPLELASESLRQLRSEHSSRLGKWLISAAGADNISRIGRRGVSDRSLTHLRDDIVERVIDDVLSKRMRGLGGPGGWFTRTGNSMDGTWQLCESGTDLYDGSLGPTLALSNAGRLLHRDDLTSLSLAWFLESEARLEDLRMRAGGLPIGVHVGYGGLLLCAADLALSLGDDFLTDRLAAAHELILDSPPDGPSDLIGGAAGLILLMESIARRFPVHREAAVRCGRTLVSSLVDTVRYESIAGMEIPRWPSMPADGLLGGVAHGFAGYATALGLGGVLNAPTRARSLASELWQCQESLWSLSRSTWRDPRSADIDKDPMREYCHGASGIGFAAWRLTQAGANLDGVDLEGIRRRAASAVLSAPVPINDSLCHGAAGNVSFLLTCAHEAQAPALEYAYGWASGLPNREFVGGSPGGLDSTGLLTGVSGIVLAVLAMSGPHRLTNPLSVEVGTRTT